MNLESLVAVLPWAAFAAPASALLAALLIGLDALRQAGRSRPATPAALERADRAERLPGRLASTAATAALLAVIAAGAGTLATGPATLLAGHWFGRIPIALTLDFAGLPFAAVIAAVGWAAVRFSRLYLHREAGFHRFLGGLCTLLGGMQLIALGGNAALVFVGWELAGFSSWLLIGYLWTRPTATANARYAFVANRIGDAGFLVAIAIGALWVGSLEWSAINAASDPLTVRLLGLCLLVAALAKSGQLPFTAWIGRALEGPTPSSAVFYGALMVHAGAFLMIRIAPLLEQVPEARLLMGVTGLATAIYAHYVARVQADIKSTLLFATVSQVGLIFVECAFGWTALAIVHLTAHAAWRSYQFLLAPSALELIDTRRRAAASQRSTHPQLYALALQRFHLDAAIDAAVVRPLVSIASDARRLDERIIGPAAGTPEPTARDDGGKGPGRDKPTDLAILGSPGLAGHLLLALADQLQRVEAHLLLQPGDSPLTRLARQVGAYLSASERLLEQPRYLFALVAVTFVVIL